MNKDQLLTEIKEIEQAYYQECNLNGGREGTTLSYGLKQQLNILIWLLEKYFHESYGYTRMN